VAFDIGTDEIRLLGFAGCLALCLAAETAFPRRAQRAGRGRRWPGNLSLFAIDVLLLRLLAPLLPVSAAAWAEAESFGMLRLLSLPGWADWILTLLLLDLAVWAQHWVLHRLPLLWPLHRVHHGDCELDTTTGLRFHPAEILLSTAYKAALAALLGAPVAAVLVFEMLLNAGSLFSHANIRLGGFDRWLRLAVVTPDMHRVHHSVRPAEMNSNFGTILPWWDRLFRTYRAQPADGHDAMRLGLEGGPEFGPLRLLADPWR
jgi:sterol desaturase/sphingolipid hydroxylase (fatty acid hydroxylase superfamily)